MAQSKPTILIVEDEKELAELIAEQLEEADMRTQVFNRVTPVARFLSKNFVNLMLLDLNLPDGSGMDLVEQLRQENITVPVIYLTASTSEGLKVKGLEIGGDDFISKPFSFAELIARIRAVLRRTETGKDTLVTKNARLDNAPFPFCGGEVHPERLEILFPDGQIEKIGRKELGILAYITASPNLVLTRQSLIHAVWGVHADVRSRSLDQYIVKIRETYGRHNCDLANFRTMHGVGYIYDLPDAPAESPAAKPAAAAKAASAPVPKPELKPEPEPEPESAPVRVAAAKPSVKPRGRKNPSNP